MIYPMHIVGGTHGGRSVEAPREPESLFMGNVEAAKAKPDDPTCALEHYALYDLPFGTDPRQVVAVFDRSISGVGAWNEIQEAKAAKK